MGKKGRLWRKEDEPRPEGEDWVEWDGQLFWAAGFTSGGALYGLTADEFREANDQCSPKRGWAHAKAALRSAVRALLGRNAVVDVGWVSKVGEGLYRDASHASGHG